MRLPLLTGSNVRLRPVTRADSQALARLANDRPVSKFIPWMSFPFSTNDARKLINQVQRSARHDLNYQFVIAPIAENGAIGMIGLNNMNWTDKNGELEYWLGKPFWERGYASDALGSLLQFAFQVLLLHRVYAITAAPNEPSWRLLERHGFVREATWRRASMIDGRWHDVYGYGLLEKEYASVRELGDK